MAKTFETFIDADQQLCTVIRLNEVFVLDQFGETVFVVFIEAFRVALRDKWTEVPMFLCLKDVKEKALI